MQTGFWIRQDRQIDRSRGDDENELGMHIYNGEKQWPGQLFHNYKCSKPGKRKVDPNTTLLQKKLTDFLTPTCTKDELKATGNAFHVADFSQAIRTEESSSHVDNFMS